MSFIWDAKNNFILLHSITLHEQQSSAPTINWSSIVNDIILEISSTPTLLQTQYEYLLETYYPKQDSKSLHTTLKHLYLHSLCQQIEDDFKITLDIVYELVRHARSKRINTKDIEQLLNEWNFTYLSDEQKTNKERLFNILNRLRDYIETLPKTDHPSILPEHSNVEQAKQNEDLEAVSDTDDDEISTVDRQNQLTNIDNNLLISNRTEQEKPSFTRRRTRSLTIFNENKDDKVNIGVEWFVPKLKRQQRSSSLHGQCHLSSPIDSTSSQNRDLESNGILLTTIDNDESSSSTSNSNIRRTHAQPAISWLPLTREQIAEKERRQTESKLIDDQQFDQVSSTDSESIEVQWSSATNNKPSTSSRRRTTSSSSSPRDLHQQEHNSSKRQRLS